MKFVKSVWCNFSVHCLILIVLNTINLTLAAIYNGENLKVNFGAKCLRAIVECLLIWWLVESFKS